jgi:hypothetical protein
MAHTVTVQQSNTGCGTQAAEWVGAKGPEIADSINQQAYPPPPAGANKHAQAARQAAAPGDSVSLKLPASNPNLLLFVPSGTRTK